jgi:hypothetical protein
MLNKTYQGSFKIGDFVQDCRYYHRGRIEKFERLNLTDPRTIDWVNQLKMQPDDEQLTGFWASILVHGGGSVLLPVNTLNITSIENYSNRFADIFADLEFDAK